MKTVIAAAFLLILLSCQRAKEVSSARDDLVKLSDLKDLYPLHKKLSEPKPGEWLYSQNEAGQTFESYIRSNPVRPDSVQNKIYLYLLGEFKQIDLMVLEKLREYVGIFFEMKVITLGPWSDDLVPKESRRIHRGHEQLHTRYILYDFLVERMAKDALVSMAITSKDLYPKDSWNFVFGQASLENRVGVSSLYYLKPEQIDSTNYHLYLNRIAKTATHEITHMLSIKHCKDVHCLMNGSMNLNEADKKPTWLCPSCLAKAIWCTDADLLKRHDRLIEFLYENGYDKKVDYYKRSKEILKL